MSNQEDFMGRLKSNWEQRAGESTTLRDELRVIPPWILKVVSALYLAGVAAVISFAILNPKALSSQGGGPVALKALVLLALVTAGAIFLGAIASLFGYIGADAKRRGMSPLLWVLIALFVPYLIGAILYFVVREPLPLNCPQCGRKVNPHFNFCPECQFNIRPNCPRCRLAIRPGDRFCPHCGFSLETNPAAQNAPTA